MILDKTLSQHYEATWQNHFAQDENDWLISLRKQELCAFIEKGFPSIRDELWKYTNLTSINSQLYCLPQKHQTVTKTEIENLLLKSDHYRLVFVDGFFETNLSLLPQKEAFIITNLKTALFEHNERVQHYLKKQEYTSALTHLNTAFMQEGAFIYVPENCQIKKPIHLIFLSTTHNADSMQNVRNIVVVNKHAEITLFEEHHSLNNHSYFANIVTQIHAEEESHVVYVKSQHQNPQSFHLANTEISQKKNSHVLVQNYNLGSQLAREDLSCYLNQKGSSLQLQGLYLPLNKQHIDLHTTIYHRESDTTSEELIKGIVAPKSRAVFNGKIVVEKNIKHAIANLQNKNLLLSPNAEVNTKPELEIYSDDVKCRHGATVGQLDKEMLFYLRSRGINYEEAYQLLLLAFVREHLCVISHPSIAEKITHTVIQYCDDLHHE